MMRDESLYPQDWFSIGEKDLKRAENLLELHDPEGTGFFIQQSLEKYLKGYLLSTGWKLRRIHSLEVLFKSMLKNTISLRCLPHPPSLRSGTLSVNGEGNLMVRNELPPLCLRRGGQGVR